MVLLPWSRLSRRICLATILAHDGAINWALNGLGLPDQNIAYTNWAMWQMTSYV
jgi:ABC-type spermidine/putrescine transport system permease subunit I